MCQDHMTRSFSLCASGVPNWTFTEDDWYILCAESFSLFQPSQLLSYVTTRALKVCPRIKYPQLAWSNYITQLSTSEKGFTY